MERMLLRAREHPFWAALIALSALNLSWQLYENPPWATWPSGRAILIWLTGTVAFTVVLAVLTGLVWAVHRWIAVVDWWAAAAAKRHQLAMLSLQRAETDLRTTGGRADLRSLELVEDPGPPAPIPSLPSLLRRGTRRDSNAHATSESGLTGLADDISGAPAPPGHGRLRAALSVLSPQSRQTEPGVSLFKGTEADPESEPPDATASPVTLRKASDEDPDPTANPGTASDEHPNSTVPLRKASDPSPEQAATPRRASDAHQEPWLTPAMASGTGPAPTPAVPAPPRVMAAAAGPTASPGAEIYVAMPAVQVEVVQIAEPPAVQLRADVCAHYAGGRNAVAALNRVLAQSEQSLPANPPWQPMLVPPRLISWLRGPAPLVPPVDLPTTHDQGLPR